MKPQITGILNSITRKYFLGEHSNHHRNPSVVSSMIDLNSGIFHQVLLTLEPVAKVKYYLRKYIASNPFSLQKIYHPKRRPLYLPDLMWMFSNSSLNMTLYAITVYLHATLLNVTFSPLFLDHCTYFRDWPHSQKCCTHRVGTSNPTEYCWLFKSQSTPFTHARQRKKEEKRSTPLIARRSKGECAKLSQ